MDEYTRILGLALPPEAGEHRSVEVVPGAPRANLDATKTKRDAAVDMCADLGPGHAPQTY